MQNIWHPYTQHKTAAPPLKIARAKEALLYTDDGREIIDAVSSWWVNPYGHGNKYIAQKIYDQLLLLDQVIFAGFTHDPALLLAERLLPLLPPGQQKVFFSDNGSTSVEVGLKMAIQYFFNLGERRRKIIAFKGAYHGDTFGAMAAGARGKFFEPFEEFIFEVIHVSPPYPGKEQEALEELDAVLTDEVCAFIFEPLVQGAAGMVMHSARALDSMIKKCRDRGVLCIADEVMTGFGRTGKNFACDHLSEQPDIICLSKGLTAGVLPMALTTCTEEVYGAFHSDDRTKALFHGHSYTGNPVGCAAALGSLDLLQSATMQENIARISDRHQQFMTTVKGHPQIARIQHMGTILSIELAAEGGNDYFSTIRDSMYGFFIARDVLLRPLGNVVYVMPPYCITDGQLHKVYKAIGEFLGQSQG